MIIMLASSAVNRGFDPRAGQINDNKIGTCCISAKHTTLRSISTDFVGSESGFVLLQISCSFYIGMIQDGEPDCYNEFIFLIV
jgi:hypothetical protein